MNQRARGRIAYIAWTVPSGASGACLAMYRHLVERCDFELFVVTDSPLPAGVAGWRVNRSRIHRRLLRTRFCRWISNYEMLVEPMLLAHRIRKACMPFKPDAILTVPDNTLSWAAFLVAQKAKLPFVTNFQDWWPRGQFYSINETPYRPVRAVLERRFWTMYRHSDLAFCTSEGMKRFLGEHCMARVLLPCPARRSGPPPDFAAPAANRPLRIVYAGTIVREYGARVLALAKALRGSTDFELVVYGREPDWPAEDREWTRNAGVYQGLLPHSELTPKLRGADAFLVVMSSAEHLRLMQQTSFTTKFLEYSQYGKPVIVWGPPYCEPVAVAKATGAGLAVEEDDPARVLAALGELRDPSRWDELARGAWQAATGMFDPDRIHSVFVDSLNSVIERKPALQAATR